jgi:hypothetical protein
MPQTLARSPFSLFVFFFSYQPFLLTLKKPVGIFIELRFGIQFGTRPGQMLRIN